MHKVKNQAKWQLFALILIFVVPVIVAVWLYHARALTGNKLVNKGELFATPIQITQLQFTHLNGEKIPIAQLHGKWIMLYVAPHGCDKTCEDNLYKMRQIRLVTGKDMDRIQRVILTFLQQPTDTKLAQLLAQPYSGTVHWVASKRRFSELMPASAAKSLAMTSGYLYLVDPLGNIMMGYKSDMSSKDILKDIQRLLRVSQVG